MTEKFQRLRLAEQLTSSGTQVSSAAFNDNETTNKSVTDNVS